MTRDEAKEIFRALGVVDPGNLAALHVAYCRYIDQRTRGLREAMPVADAYAELRKIEPPKANQAGLFNEKFADL
jgi:hypothetical protein